VVGIYISPRSRARGCDSVVCCTFVTGTTCESRVGRVRVRSTVQYRYSSTVLVSVACRRGEGEEREPLGGLTFVGRTR